MSIEVTIERETIERWGNEVHTANYVLTELRKAGAPVRGGLFPIGVERGRLTVEEDAFGNLLVTWSE